MKMSKLNITQICLFLIFTALAFSACNPDVEGCMDLKAINYNPEATIQDNSCLYTVTPIYGCTNPKADNYNPNANTNDGSCIFSGCTDINAANYDPFANVNDGSCLYAGCTDSTAWNYNPLATIDDGSCDYDMRNMIAGGYTANNCAFNFTNSLSGNIVVDSSTTDRIIFDPFFLNGETRYAIVNGTSVLFPSQSYLTTGTMTGTGTITSDSTMECTLTFQYGILPSNQCTINYEF